VVGDHSGYKSFEFKARKLNERRKGRYTGESVRASLGTEDQWRSGRDQSGPDRPEDVPTLLQVGNAPVRRHFRPLHGLIGTCLR
jgi:hypothetical protein